ncbi:COG4973: Site-specific recombinase XerC [hydrothermal vent metagenome]|uniref:COG4973: Site-specific recombinase XerC n=1 Tax=hydrothermal vent metagenome TaxID=652676 RepID=A0A3B0XTV6_9ZZZZ
MIKHNAENVRAKRKYLIFLKEAKRQDESSLDAVAMSLSRFEKYTNFKNFKAFNFNQAVGFKKHLAKQENKQTGKLLSKATQNSTLRNLKAFFQWLAMQAGYKSRLNYSEMEYFNLSEKDTRVATASRAKPVPTIEQIKHTIENMPVVTDIENRNRALIAFTLITGMRDSAIASLKLKHVDLIAGSVFQDAKDVNTKFSKTFTTVFFPVGDDILKMFEDWVKYLKDDLLYGNDEPLFPKTNVIRGNSKKFEPSGFKKEHWSNVSPYARYSKRHF